jgi:UDP-N-acetylmuramate--alanine ligase
LGGIGMSAIARLLLAAGRAVSGSDQADSDILRELASKGAKTYIGHAAANVTDAGAVVISTAINQSNPELARAYELNLPIMHRSDVLRHLGESSKMIAVSGTHGKTTTTGMISQVLLDCGFDPSIVVGGIFARIGSNSHPGHGEYFVAEADESDRTHGQLTSYISVITNIEADHLENYPGGLTQIKDVMVAFANKTSRAVVICQDDPGCRSIAQQIAAPKITYGKLTQDEPATYQYELLAPLSMRIYKGSTPIGEVNMAVPGEHNMLNALASVSVALELGADFKKVAESLSQFGGVDRRFQLLGEENGILVVDDYAHHPTEVVATLKAAKQFIQTYSDKNGKKLTRVVALFQPHQPTRLRDLWSEFCTAFVDADLLLLADVYVARGSSIEGIDSERLSQSVKHNNCRYLPGKADELIESVAAQLKPGDLLLTIGAGDVTRVGPQLLQQLKQGKPNG